jgi:signal transduction histidine kinase
MHEINNPLEAIMNIAYLVSLEADDPDKVRSYVQLLEEQLSTVIRIAHQTLSYYRPSQALQPVDLVLLTEAALRVHEQKMTAKLIHIIKSPPVDTTATVYPGEILQVVSNLISNAVDALPESGTLRLRVRKLKDHIHITIADNGHGISSTVIEKIFDPTYSTKREHGTGLGLAITKSIVDRHNGTITTRSCTREGRSGTTFRVSLPLAI